MMAMGPAWFHVSTTVVGSRSYYRCDACHFEYRLQRLWKRQMMEFDDPTLISEFLFIRNTLFKKAVETKRLTLEIMVFKLEKRCGIFQSLSILVTMLIGFISGNFGVSVQPVWLIFSGWGRSQ